MKRERPETGELELGPELQKQQGGVAGSFYLCDLLTRQSSNTGQLLALQQLERSTATGGNVGELVFDTVLGSNGSGVTTTDDNDGSGLGSLDSCVEGLLGSLGEGLHLEDTGGSVPKDSLGLSDGLLVLLDRLGADVKAHVTIGNAGLVGGRANGGVSGELVGSHVVHWQDDLNVVLLSLLDNVTDNLATGLVEQTVADLDVLKGLLEGESHATSNDQAVNLGQQVVNQLNLVRDLGTTEDSKEGALRVLEGFGEVLQLFLHEETGSLLRQLNANHGAVSTVGGTEGIV